MLFRVKSFVYLGLFSAFVSTASAVSFPRGCEVTGFSYNNNYLVLTPQSKQTLYLIQNKSNTMIQLERHETRDIFMSPKLQTNLAAANWAAFASDEENLYFQCNAKENEANSKINCNEVLEVCQYPRAKFALSNMGNYWVSTNKQQNLIIKEAVAKGIYLKW